MKKAVIALLLVTMGVLPVLAQTENFQVYFDDNYTQATAECPAAPPGTVLDTLYVVANNFNMWVSAGELSVQYPAELAWIADIPNTPLAIGSTPTGVAYSWTLPQSAFGPFEVCKVLVSWMCNDCAGTAFPGGQVIVQPHPQTGFARLVRYPDNVVVDGIGLTSLVCAQVPVEETTWGRLKALFETE